MKRKLLAILTCICMLVAMMPTYAFAEEGEEAGGGLVWIFGEDVSAVDSETGKITINPKTPEDELMICSSLQIRADSEMIGYYAYSDEEAFYAVAPGQIEIDSDDIMLETVSGEHGGNGYLSKTISGPDARVAEACYKDRNATMSIEIVALMGGLFWINGNDAEIDPAGNVIFTSSEDDRDWKDCYWTIPDSETEGYFIFEDENCQWHAVKYEELTVRNGDWEKINNPRTILEPIENNDYLCITKTSDEGYDNEWITFGEEENLLWIRVICENDGLDVNEEGGLCFAPESKVTVDSEGNVSITNDDNAIWSFIEENPGTVLIGYYVYNVGTEEEPVWKAVEWEKLSTDTQSIEIMAIDEGSEDDYLCKTSYADEEFEGKTFYSVNDNEELFVKTWCHELTHGLFWINGRDAEVNETGRLEIVDEEEADIRDCLQMGPNEDREGYYAYRAESEDGNSYWQAIKADELAILNPDDMEKKDDPRTTIVKANDENKYLCRTITPDECYDELIGYINGEDILWMRFFCENNGPDNGNLFWINERDAEANGNGELKITADEEDADIRYCLQMGPNEDREGYYAYRAESEDGDSYWQAVKAEELSILDPDNMEKKDDPRTTIVKANDENKYLCRTVTPDSCYDEIIGYGNGDKLLWMWMRCGGDEPRGGGLFWVPEDSVSFDNDLISVEDDAACEYFDGVAPGSELCGYYLYRDEEEWVIADPAEIEADNAEIEPVEGNLCITRFADEPNIDCIYYGDRCIEAYCVDYDTQLFFLEDYNNELNTAKGTVEYDKYNARFSIYSGPACGFRGYFAVYDRDEELFQLVNVEDLEFDTAENSEYWHSQATDDNGDYINDYLYSIDAKMPGDWMTVSYNGHSIRFETGLPDAGIYNSDSKSFEDFIEYDPQEEIQRVFLKSNAETDIAANVEDRTFYIVADAYGIKDKALYPSLEGISNEHFDVSGPELADNQFIWTVTVDEGFEGWMNDDEHSAVPGRYSEFFGRLNYNDGRDEWKTGFHIYVYDHTHKDIDGCSDCKYVNPLDVNNDGELKFYTDNPSTDGELIEDANEGFYMNMSKSVDADCNYIYILAPADVTDLSAKVFGTKCLRFDNGYTGRGQYMATTDEVSDNPMTIESVGTYEGKSLFKARLNSFHGHPDLLAEFSYTDEEVSYSNRIYLQMGMEIEVNVLDGDGNVVKANPANVIKLRNMWNAQEEILTAQQVNDIQQVGESNTYWFKRANETMVGSLDAPGKQGSEMLLDVKPEAGYVIDSITVDTEKEEGTTSVDSLASIVEMYYIVPIDLANNKVLYTEAEIDEFCKNWSRLGSGGGDHAAIHAYNIVYGSKFEHDAGYANVGELYSYAKRDNAAFKMLGVYPLHTIKYDDEDYTNTKPQKIVINVKKAVVGTDIGTVEGVDIAANENTDFTTEEYEQLEDGLETFYGDGLNIETIYDMGLKQGQFLDGVVNVTIPKSELDGTDLQNYSVYYLTKNEDGKLVPAIMESTYTEDGIVFTTGHFTPYMIVKSGEYPDVTVTFNTNEGSAIDSKTADYNSSVEKPDDPTKNGYEFAGWYSDKACSDGNEFDFNSQIKNDTTLYAKWVPISYVITYELDGGENSNANPIEYTIEGDNIDLVNPSKTEYTFDGWYADAEFTNKVETIAKGSTGNITLYAKWTPVEYTITYTGGSNDANPVKYTIETEDITLAAPEKTGYTFGGWYNGETKVEKIVKGSTGNVALEAKWTPVEYTITYTGGSNTENPEKYTIETEDITLAAPEKTGYTFGGWYNGETKVEKIVKGSTGDVIVEAKWNVNNYSITYGLAGGTLETANPETYTVEDSFVFNNPTRTGYAFDGWYAGETKVTGIEKGTIGDKTITAKWTENGYTITYNLADGTNAASNPATYTVNSGTVTFAEPSKTGYTFGGWYSDSEYKNAVTGIPAGSTGDVTVYAKWAPVEYTITYTGGSNDANPVKYTIETEDITLAAPEKTGYTFGGWYNGETKVEKIVKGSTGNVALEAKWTPVEYTITYTGGSNIENPEKYTIETEDITLAAPEKTGYTFGGWYDGDNKVEKIANGSTGDVELEAKWTVNNYSITYGLAGGTLETANPETYTVEDSFVFNNPTRTGYAFDGWYIGETKVTGIEKGTIGDKTITAKWTENGYTITYNLNDGTNAASNPGTYTVNSEDITFADPVKTGYTFDGWYNGTAKVEKIAKGSTGNVELTAKWTPVEYSITYTGGSNGANPVKYTIESDEITLAAPEKPGYTFGGWYNGETKVEKIVKGSTGNVALEAKWTVNTYSIAYNANGGTVAEGAPVEYTVEANASLPTVTKEGFTFGGWYLNSSLTGSEVTTTAGLTGNITLYAKWSEKNNQQTGGGGGVLPPAEDTEKDPVITNDSTESSTNADVSSVTVVEKDSEGKETASTTVTDKVAEQIVAGAVSNNSEEIVINAVTGTKADTAKVEISGTAAENIADKTNADVLVKTDAGDMELEADAFASAAGQIPVGDNLIIIIERVDEDAASALYEISIVTSSGAKITSFEGGNLNITVAIPEAIQNKEVVCVYVDDEGNKTRMAGKKNADGKTYTFTTNHLSGYSIMTEEDLDAEAIAKATKVTKKMVTSKTEKGNVKLTVKYTKTAKNLKAMGYKVSYKYYYSKTGKTYKAIRTSSKSSTAWSKYKRGQKYYYKYKMIVKDASGEVIYTSSLKNCKRGYLTIK